MPVRATLALAIGVSLVVQWAFVRPSWFFLDDVQNFARARQLGLTWGFLTRPLGEHFTPGHRLLDWLVAVPFGQQWSAAVVLILVFGAVMLAYLGGTLELLFGSHRRNAIPLLLAGTAWPLLANDQWFAPAASALLVATSLVGAMYHHLRWRLHGRRADRIAALGWTVIGLLGSQQATLIPALVLVAALVARDRWGGWEALWNELVAVLPLAIPCLAVQLYVGAQSWSAPLTIPSPGAAFELVKAMVLRALLPALAGIGIGAPPEPSRQVVMQLLAAAVLVAAVLGSWWLRRRWTAAMALAASGTILTAVPIALARLSIIGPSQAGSTPRYLLPAIVFDALAVGALLAPQHRRAERYLHRRAALTLGTLALVWTGVYAANLRYTYHAANLAFVVSGAAHEMTARLERSLRLAAATGYENAIVDGPLPYPLSYSNTGYLSSFGQFFVAAGVEAPGVARDGQLLAVGPDGGLQRAAFAAAGAAVTCTVGIPCVVPDAVGQGSIEPVLRITLRRPAPASAWLKYAIRGTNRLLLVLQRRVRIPEGATSLVIPAVLAYRKAAVATFAEHAVEIGSVEGGRLTPP